jgi:hypothetical protein
LLEMRVCFVSFPSSCSPYLSLLLLLLLPLLLAPVVGPVVYVVAAGSGIKCRRRRSDLACFAIKLGDERTNGRTHACLACPPPVCSLACMTW